LIYLAKIDALHKTRYCSLREIAKELDIIILMPWNVLALLVIAPINLPYGGVVWETGGLINWNQRTEYFCEVGVKP